MADDRKTEVDSRKDTDLDSQYKPIGIAVLRAAALCKGQKTSEKPGRRDSA